MINTELLKIHMKQNGIESFEDLATEIGYDADIVNEWIQEKDAPVGFAEATAKRLGIPVTQLEEIFFAQPHQEEAAKSKRSCRSNESQSWSDVLLEMFEDLDLRAKHKLLALAYELHDQKKAVEQ